MGLLDPLCSDSRLLGFMLDTPAVSTPLKRSLSCFLGRCKSATTAHARVEKGSAGRYDTKDLILLALASFTVSHHSPKITGSLNALLHTSVYLAVHPSLGLYLLLRKAILPIDNHSLVSIFVGLRSGENKVKRRQSKKTLLVIYYAKTDCEIRKGHIFRSLPKC